MASLLLLLQEASVPYVPDAVNQSEATEGNVDAELKALAQVCYSTATEQGLLCCCTCRSTDCLACLQDLQLEKDIGAISAWSSWCHLILVL